MAVFRVRLWAVLQILFCIAFQVHAYDIKGPTGGVKASGQRPARQNLVTFQNSGPAFDLYILSFDKFQKENQAAKLGFFEVAGIACPTLLFGGESDVLTWVPRNPRLSIQGLGWCERARRSRLLCPCFDIVPLLASSISCPL